MSIRAKSAKQKRSELKRDRIINALKQLLMKKEFEQITISEVATEAGVSAATIYQRFSNRDASVSILIELYLQQIEEWARSSDGKVNITDACDLDEALIMIGRSAWRQVESIGYVMRPAYLYSRLRPDLIGDTWHRLEQDSLAGFKKLISQFKGEIHIEDEERAASMIAYFFNFMLLGKLLHNEKDSWGNEKMLKSEELFARELAAFAHSFLTRNTHNQGGAA